MPGHGEGKKQEGENNHVTYAGGHRAAGERKTDTRKGAWGMPRLSEAKKDVTSCEKPWRGANTLRPTDIRMGQPGGSDPAITPKA